MDPNNPFINWKYKSTTHNILKDRMMNSNIYIYIMSIYETISIYARKSFFSSSNPKNWGSEQSIMSREEYDKLATSSHSISMRLHAVIRYKYMEGPLFAECYPMETSGF